MADDKGERGPRGERGDMGDRGPRGIPGIPEQGWWLVRELEHLRESMEELKVTNREDHQRVVAELHQVREEIGGLKAKASLFGALSGLGAGIAIFMAQLFGHGFGPK